MELVADAVVAIARERGRVRLALAGGSVAERATLLTDALRARDFDFATLALTWVDERCVPVASPESNRGTTAWRPRPGTTLPLFEDGESPEQAVARVAEGLERDFGGGLDVLLLGMGPDGHIASLFVGHDPLPGTVGYVDDSPKPPPRRITLTRPFLATASHAILVASGEPKRDALERLRAGDERLPATGLPGLVVVTDLDLGEST